MQIIDDGCQWQHPDLKDQYVASASHNFNRGNPDDPSPNVQSDYHGTSCSGVATARNNSYCGVGAAYRASLAGVRLISAGVDDATEAEGITYAMDEVSVMSCSWGPTDDGRRLEGPGRVSRMAMEAAVQKGRSGKGSIWMWAGGNGGGVLDDCNYDGYANNPMTIAIGAVSDLRKQAWYSEPCAALITVAPSNGGTKGITTTDLMGRPGYSTSDCTNDFGGTSSAAPLAAGVVALMLSANPKLGWKDVQYILMTTADRVDPTDSDWKQNGAGRWVNHKYGYGLINAHSAVVAAQAYTAYLNVSINRYALPKKIVEQSIPQYSPTEKTSVSSTITVLTPANFGTVQHVEIFFDATHPRATELDVVLTSPMGTESQLAEMRGFTTRDWLTINSPASIAGRKSGILADWSQSPTAPISGIAKVFPDLGCDGTLPPANDTSYRGFIVFVSRGVCGFTEKARNVQSFGAKAVIVYNNLPGEAIPMGGQADDITIPAMMVMLEVADSIKQQSAPVHVTVEVPEIIKDNVVLRYSNWGFTSARHWGEPASGVWKLTVSDRFGVPGSPDEGDFKSWTLVLWNDHDNSGVVPTPAPPPPIDPTTQPSEWEDLLIPALILLGACVVAAAASLLYMAVKKKGPFRRQGETQFAAADIGSVDQEFDNVWDDDDAIVADF